MLSTPNTRTVALTRPLDLRLTLSPFRLGKGDPSCLLRFDESVRASRTPQGPATLHLVVRRGELAAEAWGDGADWALEHVPVLVGEHDDTEAFSPRHALVADLHARTPGLRIGATHRVFESLLPAVCAQKVSAYEAKRAYRQIMEAFGEPAPGPSQLDLRVPPDPRVLASVGTQDLHPLGLERARADVVRRAAARAASVESVVDIPMEEAERRLRAIAGVGLWTASMIRATALGDTDVVPVGDPTLKHVVAFALAGERHGTDAQMLELLEPFRGHRGRVVRLLRAAKLGPPRHGT